MKMNEIQGAVEAILFASGEPLEVERISEALETDVDTIKEAISVIKEILIETGSGICVLELGEKYQLCTKQEFSDKVRAVLEIKKNTPLSNAAFEVLAVIAYNQPVTKSFIEQVRGVDCSGVVQTLTAKGLIEERGRLELPGRPLVYGTTAEFLKCFCISSLDDLPELPDHEDSQGNANELPDQISINLEDGNIIVNSSLDYTEDDRDVSDNNETKSAEVEQI